MYFTMTKLDFESYISEEPERLPVGPVEGDLNTKEVLERLQKKPKIQIGDLNYYFQPGLVLTHETSFVDGNDKPVYLDDLDLTDYQKIDFFVAIKNFLENN